MIDSDNIEMVNIFPPFVVSSKKKITKRMLVNTKLDLSIGATLLISPSFKAL